VLLASQISPTTHLRYSQPFFYLLDFSIALNRRSQSAQNSSTYDANLGYIAFGGIAPVPTTLPAVTIPVQNYTSSSGSGAKVYAFYTINIDAYIFNGSTQLNASGSNLTTRAILDTGTTLNYLPTEMAKLYNTLFVPPAVYDLEEGLYYVTCNTTAPEFHVQIGGKMFEIDGRDQIVGPPFNYTSAGVDDAKKVMCISGTQDGGVMSGSHDTFILCVHVLFLFNLEYSWLFELMFAFLGEMCFCIMS
jgi:hypothetical protein